MRKMSQTLLSDLRQAVNTWRRRENWSRESVAQVIVAAYSETEGATVTGLRFDPPTMDVYQRAHVNADRIFRWLDDETKDNNLLPVNFLPYLLAILPQDLRLIAVNQMLAPSALGARLLPSPTAQDFTTALSSVARESGESVAAIATLLDGATPEELAAARKELSESIAAGEAALRLIEAHCG